MESNIFCEKSCCCFSPSPGLGSSFTRWSASTCCVQFQSREATLLSVCVRVGVPDRGMSVAVSVAVKGVGQKGAYLHGLVR